MIGRTDLMIDTQ